MPQSKKWCLNANYADKSLLRNKFASILGNEVFNSGWNPKFNHVEFILNGDGQIDLYDGGFVLEFDTTYGEELFFDTKKGLPITLKDPDNVSDGAWDHIKNLVQNAEDILFSENFKDTQNGWRKFFEDPSFTTKLNSR